MSELQFHQITEQLESLSWKVDQLYNEVDAQVEKMQAKLTATLEIHERIAVLEALAAARPVRHRLVEDDPKVSAAPKYGSPAGARRPVEAQQHRIPRADLGARSGRRISPIDLEDTRRISAKSRRKLGEKSTNYGERS